MEVQNKKQKINEIEEPIHFFLYDLQEDFFNRKGQLILYGKKLITNQDNEENPSYQSCCLRVVDLMRILYVIPKKGYSLDNVVEEIKPLFRKKGIKEYKITFASKKCCFPVKDSDIECEDVLKIKYSYKESNIPSNLTGNTFTKIFGIENNPSDYTLKERFILKKKIMGPCWLFISKFTPIINSNEKISSSDYEYTIKTSKYIHNNTTMKTPPIFNTISISLRVTSDKEDNRIIGCSYAVFPYFMDKKNDIDIEKKCKSITIQKEPLQDESFIIRNLLHVIKTNDIDIICGHDFYETQLPLLLNRCSQLNIEEGWNIGRTIRRKSLNNYLKEGNIKYSSWKMKSVCEGRIICDTYINSKNFLKEKSYSLDSLYFSQFNEKYKEITLTKNDYIQLDSKEMDNLHDNMKKEVEFVIRIIKKLDILILSYQITIICGNLWSQTLSGGISHRIEYLLLHQYYDNGYILPDKCKSEFSKKKGDYKGGHVLDPVKGLHKTIILYLDLISFYPSIILEHNLDIVNNKNGIETPLPQLIQFLLDQRRIVKEDIKKEKIDYKKDILESKGRAFKLTANGTYGYFTFSNSRFYHMEIAEKITEIGRKILIDTVNELKNIGLSVVYGDTDSMMVDTKTKDHDIALEIASKIKTLVNCKYKKIKLDLSCMFSSFLLVTKKRYAALVIQSSNTIVDIKGLEVIKRNWCDLSCEVGKYVLQLILESYDKDIMIRSIISYLKEIKKELLSGSIPIIKLQLSEMLSKYPTEYLNSRDLYHVIIALEMIKNEKKVRIGDSIPYVLCLSESHKRIPIHIDDYDLNKTLLDYDWYLENQIYKPVFRYLDCIEGLGLDDIRKELDIKIRAHTSQPQTKTFVTDISLLEEHFQFYESKENDMDIEGMIDIVSSISISELFDNKKKKVFKWDLFDKECIL